MYVGAAGLTVIVLCVLIVL